MNRRAAAAVASASVVDVFEFKIYISHITVGKKCGYCIPNLWPHHRHTPHIKIHTENIWIYVWKNVFTFCAKKLRTNPAVDVCAAEWLLNRIFSVELLCLWCLFFYPILFRFLFCFRAWHQMRRIFIITHNSCYTKFCHQNRLLLLCQKKKINDINKSQMKIMAQYFEGSIILRNAVSYNNNKKKSYTDGYNNFMHFCKHTCARLWRIISI